MPHAMLANRRHALALSATAAASLALTGGVWPRRAWAQPSDDWAADKRALALQLVAQFKLDPAWVQACLDEAEFRSDVVKFSTPAKAAQFRNWRVYRDRFIEPKRIGAGVDFWDEHDDELIQAEATFGVPAWLVVGIVGVETLYGQHMGRYRLIDALTTLALRFPPEHPKAAARAQFFTAELGAFLQMAAADRSRRLDDWLGSYAGAMGWGQFMPSSWQRYAVDFDGDGRIDLIHSSRDALGSVANYMKAHRWTTGMPTTFSVTPPRDPALLAKLLEPDILPSFTAEEMTRLGADLPPQAQRFEGKLALVKLENGDPAKPGGKPTYVAGTTNFYTVTRYNWSSYYAMAVIGLGQAVQAARLRALKG